MAANRDMSMRRATKFILKQCVAKTIQENAENAFIIIRRNSGEHLFYENSRLLERASEEAAIKLFQKTIFEIYNK